MHSGVWGDPTGESPEAPWLQAEAPEAKHTELICAREPVPLQEIWICVLCAPLHRGLDLLITFPSDQSASPLHFREMDFLPRILSDDRICISVDSSCLAM